MTGTPTSPHSGTAATFMAATTPTAGPTAPGPYSHSSPSSSPSRNNNNSNPNGTPPSTSAALQMTAAIPSSSSNSSNLSSSAASPPSNGSHNSLAAIATPPLYPSSTSSLASPRTFTMNGASHTVAGTFTASNGAATASRPATPSSAGSNGVFMSLPVSLAAASMGGVALEEVRQWGDSQVQAWLASHRLAHHATTFARNDITGNVLLDVDQNALKEMGITAIGDRIRIFTAIKALKKRCIETAQTNRTALLRAQERAEQAHLARIHAEQLREDAQLLADLNRPHTAAELDGGGGPASSPLISSGNTTLTDSTAASSWRFNNTPSATTANTTLSPTGFSAGSASTGGMRKGHHSRPPPLRLSGSATSNVTGTPPPYPSPSSMAAFNNGQGMGLSQARGLTPGSSHRHNQASGRSKPSAGSSSPALPGNEQPSMAAGATSPPMTLTHRKTNSALGGASFLQRNTTTTSGPPISQRQFGSYAGQGTSSTRPSTASGGGGGGAGAAAPSSAYKLSSASSPTNPTFGRSNTGANVAGRPSTADTANDLSHRQGTFSSMGAGGISTSNSNGSMPSDGSVPLTPINEGNGYSPTTPSAATTSHFANSRSVRGGSIAGASGSTTLPATGSTTPSGPAPPSLEDLKRRTIKFIGADGTTRIVNVSDCRDAHDVLARVLKKFGKNPASNSYPPTLGQGGQQQSQVDGTTANGASEGTSSSGTAGDVEKYVIVATSGEGATRDLKPEELLAICHAPQPYDPLRERGLTLRRISPSSANAGDSTSRRIARSGRHKLEAFFGERSFNDGGSGNKDGLRPSSPALTNSTGQSPSFLGEDPSGSMYSGHVTTAGKKMNRASTVSIMSGLGVSAALGVLSGHRDHRNDNQDASSSDYYYHSPNQQSSKQQQSQSHSQSSRSNDRSSSGVPTPSEGKSNSSGKSKTSSIFPQKARNFMGQRPPSELISSHLADYFPAAEKKVLERTARRSIYGRASSSIRSNKRDSTWSFNAVAERDETPPPLPNKTSLDVTRSESRASANRVEPSAPMLPPVVGRTSLDEWSQSLQTVGAKSDASSASLRSGGRLEIPDGSSQRPSVGSANSMTASSPGGGSVSSGGYSNNASGLAGTSPAPSSSSTRPRNVRQGSGVSTSRASIDSGRSRKSYASALRAARGIGTGASHRGSSAIDRSDAASMLTVDEITQEVENRRESMSIMGLSPSEMDEEEEHVKDEEEGDASGWVVDEDGVPIPVGPQKSTAMRSRRGTGPGSASVMSHSSRKKKRRTGGATTDARTPTNATTFSQDSAPARRPSDGEEVEGDEDDEEEEDPYDDSIFHGDSGDDGGEGSGEDDGLSSEFDDSDDSDVEGSPGDGGRMHRSDGSQHVTGNTSALSSADSSGTNAGMTSTKTSGMMTAGTGSSTMSKSTSTAGKQPIKWIKGALIGAGSFGSVFLGMNAKNGLLMAVKQVELPSGQSQNDQKKKRMLDALEGEIELLKTLEHDNIVQYLDSYADGTHLNIFLEYVPGGSVVALLRNYGAFEEPLVRNFVRQILQGLSFLHNKDIVHRDIKGANILVDNKSCIKISDFGISKKVESDLLANARAHRPSLQGSVFWMAPEVVKQTSYTRKADIWSLGCLVVEMMSGTHPWPNLNQMQALFKIGSSAKPSLPDEISEEAVDFLNLTFELDHEARPSADELLQHAFIVEGGGMAGQRVSVDEVKDAGGDDGGAGGQVQPSSSAAAGGGVDSSDPRTPTRATAAGNATTPTKSGAAASADSSAVDV